METFNGGGETLQDKGGEYFVSQDVDYQGEGIGTSVKRTFDRQGRSEGKDLKHEALLEAYETQMNFVSSMESMGAEIKYTNSRHEARAGMLKLPSSVAMPSVIKYGSGFTNKNLVQISQVEDDIVVFAAKNGDEVVEGISNFTVVGDKLHLNGLHLQGSSAEKIGRSNLWKMAKELGRKFGVKEVVVQGGRRTTGKYKGKVPSELIIKVD